MQIINIILNSVVETVARGANVYFILKTTISGVFTKYNVQVIYIDNSSSMGTTKKFAFPQNGKTIVIAQINIRNISRLTCK